MTEKKTGARERDPDGAGPEGRSEKIWTEEIEVTGEHLIAAVKRLAAEGSVRRIRLSDPDGDTVFEMPLTFGAVAGGAVVIAAPLLALIGALAVFVGRVKIEVVREGEGPEDGALQ